MGSLPSVTLKLNSVVNVCAGNDPDAYSHSAANTTESPDVLVITDSAPNTSARAAANLCAFLQIMTTSCRRLEGTQNPCRHRGSGQLIDRFMSVQEHGPGVSPGKP